jgi:hypothetical protein
MATTLIPKIGAVGTLVQSQTDASGATVLVGAGGPIDTINRSNTPVVLYDGDSITARYKLPDFPATEGVANVASGLSTGGYPTWEQAQLNNVYSIVDQAVSGETIEQITTRLLATDLSGYAAVSLMCGANNFNGSTTADVAADIALIDSVAAYCLTYQKPLRVLTMLPPDTSVLVAAENAYIIAFNTEIKKLPQRYPHVFVGDAFIGLQDTTAADPTPITGTIYTGDASKVHPTKKGSFLAAKVSTGSMEEALRYAGYGRVIDSKAMADDGEAYTELLTNTDFKTQTGGTDSTAGILTTGVVPSGWRLLNTSSTDIKIYYPFYVPEATRQRGIWVTAYVYEVGDAVTDTGGAYICTAAHTAGATFAGDAANWKRVWCSDYCLQVQFTGDAANDGITIQRASALSAITAAKVVQGFCGLASEGDTSKIKGSATGMFLVEAYGATYAHFNCSAYPPSGVTEESVGERFEGIYQTSRQAFFAGGGTIQSQQFKIVATLNAAGTASIIIYKPSLRSYP